MAKELPKRSEVKEEYTWDLSAMFVSKEAWEEQLAVCQSLTGELEAFEGKVTASAKNLLTVLEKSADAEQKLELAFSYAERLFDQDQKNTAHQAMSQRMHTLYTDYSSRTAFIVPEILAADTELLEQYLNEEPELALYRGQIQEIQRRKAHSLSSEMEKLVAMTGEMAQVPVQVFSIISNADMAYPQITDENGETVRLSHGNFVPLEESADRRVRKDAFENFYSVYRQFANTLAGLYNGQVKQQIFYAKARNYPSTLEAAVDANNVPSKVYYNLVETVNKNMDKMHRYVRLRKKCLGVDELHMYDIYTPMIADVAKKIPFEEAKETVLKALAPLGEDYVSKVKEGFEGRWLDVYENEGKRSGAYSAGAYGAHPYVLLNHNDTLDNMFTLAHEMGHAMHSYYSNENQPYIYAGYKIFVAEVASTCNEILLMEYLLANTEDQKERAYLLNHYENQPYIYAGYKIFVAEVASTCNEILLMEYLLANTEDQKERAYLLNHYLDSFKGTVYRQTMFAEYEMRSNAMVENGENLTAENLCALYLELNKKYYGPDMVSDEDQTMFAEYEMRSNAMVENGENLTAENLCALYLELNKKYYGPDMVSDEEISYEWARIPHFYNDFYVYQYATSFSAAVAIAHEILEKGAPAVERYKEFLSGGCSKSPVELLKMVGINMEEATPIQNALDVFGEVLDEIETLI